MVADDPGVLADLEVVHPHTQSATSPPLRHLWPGFAPVESGAGYSGTWAHFAPNCEPAGGTQVAAGGLAAPAEPPFHAIYHPP
jgi:hypothetical protein